MPWKFFEDPRVQQSLDPLQYLEVMAAQAGTGGQDLDDEAAQKLEFTKLNLHRSQRIDRTYQVPPELAELLNQITEPQFWLVITEPWCGDSAQCLPYLAVMARCNPQIKLAIIQRDDNLEIMDEFLTDGKRAIPRLVAFSNGGEELFRWGPRPAAAQEVFDQARAENLAKPDLLAKLHLFYGRNRGQALEMEFMALLKGYLEQ